MTTKRRFNYDTERRQKGARQRLWANEFASLIDRAAAGETGPLREYLESDAPLSEQHRSLLAALIYRRIQRKGRGKRGDPAPRPIREAVRRVAHEVRKLQKERGWKNLSKPRKAALIEEVGAGLAEAGIFDDIENDSLGRPINISIADVESELRKLGRRPARR